MEILIFVVLIFGFLFWYSKKHGDNSSTTDDEIKQINFLLSQVDLWFVEGLVDREKADIIKKRYETKKRLLLGMAPEDSIPFVPDVQEEVREQHSKEPALHHEQIEPKVFARAEKPKKPAREKPSFNLMNFLREKNIKWFNALGTIMLLASGIIFVATNWSAWNGGIKSLIMILVTGFFFLGGYFIKNKLELTTSGFAFYLVGSLFVPLNMVAFNNFAVFGRQFDWNGYLAITAIVATGFFSFMAYKEKSRIFVGLAASTGGAGLFEFLNYNNLSYSRAGIFFVPLALLYFVLYYLLSRKRDTSKKLLLPLPLAANAMAAVGLGLAAVDKLSFALFTTAIIASMTYLVSTYLFKRLEYLYVFVGMMVLSVFPGVGYYQLPGRSYNLSFIFIAGLALFMSYLNRRINNRKFEKNFFYTMLGITVLAGSFAVITQISLFSSPLKNSPELAAGMVTMFGGAIIYFLSAGLYNKKRFNYIGIAAFAAGYTMGLMWLGISGKLYGIFYLALSAILLVIHRLLRDKEVWSVPAYISGIITNALVTMLLTILMLMNPQIFAQYDTNLLAGIIALLLNTTVYFYLALVSKAKSFTAIGSGVFALAYIITSVYLGLSKWQFGLYFMGLVLIYLLAEMILKPEFLRAPIRVYAVCTNYFPFLYYIVLFYYVFVGSMVYSDFKEVLFNKYNAHMALVIGTFLLITCISVFLAVLKRVIYLYPAAAINFINFMIFYNWLGLPKAYIGALLMLVVVFYLALSRKMGTKGAYTRALTYSAIGSNIVTTGLMVLFSADSVTLQYTALTMGLLANAAVYFYYAYDWKNPAFTWAGLVPVIFAYYKFIRWFKIDPEWHYLGLIIILLALALIGAGLYCRKKSYKFYYMPLLTAGYGISALSVSTGFITAENLIYPSFLAMVLYGATTFLTPLYRQWFWRAALITANISFGAILYKIDPYYTLVTYVKYFVIFNLLKFGLGFYFQHFEKKMDFAWSNYIGVIITSLVSLIITAVSGDSQAAGLVWITYGIIYFSFGWLLKQQAAAYVSAFSVTGGVIFVLDYLSVEDYQIGVYLAVLSFLWIWLNVALKKHKPYFIPLTIIVPVSIGLPLLYNLTAGYDACIVGSLIAAGAIFAQGKLQEFKAYYYAGPLVLITAFEAFLLKYQVSFQELYLAPVSLYLIIISFFLRRYDKLLNYISYIGIGAFFATSYLNSFAGDYYLVHALVLGIAAVVSVIMGVVLRHRGFFFIGVIFLLGDVVTQSRNFLMSLQKWFWIGLGGSLFLALGLLFDKKRKDRTLLMVNRQIEKFKGWV